MNTPSIQMMTIGQISLPHCWLRPVTVAGARNKTRLTPKLVGFQRCRPRTRSVYFDAMEMKLHRMYGHNSGERIRMPTLMPEIYALARYGHLPSHHRPRTNS